MPINTSSYPKTWQTTLCAFSACALLASGPALAANADDWTGNFAIGFEHAAGGIDSTNVNASFSLSHNQNFQQNDPLRHIFSISIDDKKTKIDGIKNTTRDKKSAVYTLGYYLDKQSHIETSAYYMEDASLDIDIGKIANVEYVRKILKNPTHQLSLSTGLAYVDIAYTNNTSLDGIGALVSYDYKGQLTKSLSFNQKTLLQATSDIRYTTIDSDLSYAITENTSLTLAHNFTHMKSEESLNQNKKDTVTNLKLSINF